MIEAAAPVETVTPTEQVQTPETAQTAGTEQTSATEEPAKDSAPAKGDWVQRRIDQLTREKYDANRRAEDAESRARQYAPPQQPEAEAPMTRQAVEQAAVELVKRRDFDSACNEVFKAGKSEFPDFESSLNTFAMLGGATPDLLEAITSMENGHRVLQHLGKDPEAAERLLAMPPLKMALALAKLESTLGQAKPVSASKAPSPISPVGSKSAPVEPAEFASTGDYIAWRKKNR